MTKAKKSSAAIRLAREAVTTMTKAEQRKLALTLSRARDLMVSIAESDHSPFRRARGRGEIVHLDQAIEMIQESVQRATVQGRRPFRGSGRRSVRS